MFERFRSTPSKGSAGDSEANELNDAGLDGLDPLYGSPEDYGTPEDVESTPTRTTEAPLSNPEIAQLRQEMNAMRETYDKRLADKDRFIGELRGELTGLTKLAGLGQHGGSEPQEDADPPLFDQESIGLIQKGMETDPAGTLTQVAEHVRRTVADSVDRRNAKQEAMLARQREAQEVLGLVTSQCRELKREFPEIGDEIDAFLEGPNPSQTEIGKIVAQDPTLLKTRRGLYAAVKAEVLASRVNAPADTLAEGVPMHSTGNTQVAPPPSSAERRVGAPRQQERSIEDRIADSIVQADSRKRDEHLRRQLIG